MSILSYVISSLLLAVVLGLLSTIHERRFGKYDISSYRWFTRILR